MNEKRVRGRGVGDVRVYAQKAVLYCTVDGGDEKRVGCVLFVCVAFFFIYFFLICRQAGLE